MVTTMHGGRHVDTIWCLRGNACSQYTHVGKVNIRQYADANGKREREQLILPVHSDCPGFRPKTQSNQGGRGVKGSRVSVDGHEERSPPPCQGQRSVRVGAATCAIFHARITGRTKLVPLRSQFGP
eukprot:jgi/Botrbrau1/16074/Bobra.7_2s0045.1